MRKYLILTALLALLFSIPVMAADEYYVGTATKQESFTQITYLWTTPTTHTDATGSTHSPAFFIGDCNDIDGAIWAVSNAAADFNFILHFSADGIKWNSTTVSALDLVTTTTKYSLVGYEGSANDIKFHAARWMIIECDGQTGVDASDYCWVVFSATKDLDVQSSGQPVMMGNIKKGKDPNWTNP
jgi:hypothetical protein